MPRPPRQRPGEPRPEPPLCAGQRGAPQLGGADVQQRGRGHTSRPLGGPRRTEYSFEVGAGWRRAQGTQTRGCVACWPLVRRGPGGPSSPRAWAEQRAGCLGDSLPSHSGPGAEEPLRTTTEDLGGPLGTGYHTRGSGGGELATEPGASPHSSRELPAGAATRMRTASELLTRSGGGVGGGEGRRPLGARPGAEKGVGAAPHRQQRIEELEEAAQFEAGQGRVMRLLQAAYQCVAAHSELLCYFIIILNHMVTASATSLVLPVLVFLWAMLSIPRPSKRFWMTAIVFTEVGRGRGGRGRGLALHAEPPLPQVSVVTKYLFQFGFFPWNTHAVLRRYENKPYFPPRILGLEKTDSYIKYDLVQLMALFFHRSQLLVSPPGLGRRAAGRHLPAHAPPAGCPAARGKAGRRGFQGGPGHLACVATPGSSPPSLLPSAVLRPLGP